MDNAGAACERPFAVRFRAALPLLFVVLSRAGLVLAEGPDELSSDALEIQALSADADVAALALFRLAEMDDAAGRYRSALGRYESMVARSPSNRYVPRATARAEVLRSHAEGDFKPLMRLEQVRTSPQRADDPGEIDALANDADRFPPGLVRVEARMLVAEACLGRVGRQNQGVSVLRKIVDDTATDPLTRRHAARMLIDALVSAHDLDGAIALAERLDPRSLDPALKTHVVVLVRRRLAHRGALFDLTLLALAAGASIARLAWTRGFAALRKPVASALPIVLGFAAYVAIAGSALAAGYEAGNATPFLVLGAVLVPLILLSRAWGAASSVAPVSRALRAVLCASAVVAGGFLVLETVDSAYLEGFGL